MMEGGIWNSMTTDLLTVSGTPPIGLDTSVVAVVDKSNEYMPIRDERFFSLTGEVVFVLMYCIVWAAMLLAFYKGTSARAYCIGFAFGILLIALEAWSYNEITRVFINEVDLHSYGANFPEVTDSKKGQRPSADMRGHGSGIISDSAGDYKVLLKNSVLPIKPNDIAIIPASKYAEYQDDGSIVAEDLDAFLANEFKRGHGYGNQKDLLFAEARDINLSNAAFYVVIICITWALYISRANLATKERMTWLICSVGMGLLTGGLTYDTGTIRDRLAFLYAMRRFLILCISFAVTAVLL